MSNRITMQDNIVTGRKFVPIGSGTISARKRLANILTSYKDVNNRFSMLLIKDITNDNVITPEEKTLLKTRWDELSSAYTRLIQTLEDSGLGDMNEVAKLKEAYATVYLQLQNILADMNTSSSVPPGFENNLNSFNEWFNIVSQSFATISYGLSFYDLRVSSSSYYLEEGGIAVLTATLYKGSEEYTGEYLKDIMDTISWTSTGIHEHDGFDGDPVNYYKSGYSVRVPYSAFDVEFSVRATVNIPYDILLPS